MEDAAESEHDWIERVDLALVVRLLGRRMFELAIASDVRYAEPPVLAEDGSVHVTVLEPGRNSRGVEDPVSRLRVRLASGDRAFTGECSRCFGGFGPCRHMAVLVVDLAASRELRAALIAGRDTRALAAGVFEARRSLEIEASFDRTLRAWLAPASEGLPLEIAATAFEASPHGRPYGSRFEEGSVLTVSVRRRGERRLLDPRELGDLSTLGARDRQVLKLAQRTVGARKSTTAIGLQASLAIEAMRTHGGIFGPGFKGLLDFRNATVRPVIETSDAASEPRTESGQTLRASWMTETGVRFPFEDAAFFPGPFPFVWTKAGAILPVARDVDLEMASELARAPVLIVPRTKLSDTGMRLLRAARGRGIVVPRTEAFGLPALEQPRFLLRLAGEPLDFVGELVAVYPKGEEPLSGPGVTAAEPPRDAEVEERASAHVENAGIVWGEEDADPDDDAYPRERFLGAVGDKAIAFWQSGLLSLRNATNPAIEIVLTPKLARVHVGSDIQPRVQVALEGNWLDTKVTFSTEDLPVELELIRQALDRKEKFVALTDGTIARITSEVEALADEAATVLGADGTARLAAHQLGRIERWLEENDGRTDAALKKLRKRLHALSVSAEPDMPRSLSAQLRPYQRLGLAWLQFLKLLGAGGVLADDMGLGKTLMTLALLQRWREDDGPEPTLVVCPTSVAMNWMSEAARFTPKLKTLLLHGGRGARQRAAISEHDLVITTYGIMRRDIDVLCKHRFRCVVLDEAQHVKNADGATRRAAGRLDGRMRLALTGTPIENRVRELWSLMSFANPGILGNVRDFDKRYEAPIAAERSADSGNPCAEELRAIVRPFLLRRTKADVLRDLPPKTEVDRFVTLGAEGKRLYDALALTLRESVLTAFEKRTTPVASLSIFTALMRLRQMATDPRLVDPHMPASASAKRAAFLDLVRELVAERRRALVFSQFVSLLSLWRADLDREGIRYEYLDGSTTRRDEVVKRFQEGDAPLFLISLKAGGAGLNLTAADTVIHCDPWWNPAVEDQATDRAYRIGQDKPVTVVRLLAAGTIEEKILSLKSKKRAIAQAVIDDSAGALAGINKDDLNLLFGDVDETKLGDTPSDDDEDDDDSLTDVIATATEIKSDEFYELARETQRWLMTTGGFETELASLLELPVPFVTLLSRGEPFPCSRAVAERIRGRLLAFRHGLI